ncbi:DUF6246 family protein [Intestinirhabdus alba]|uniref:Uncharacterized protein n=1 Tax=Intestinirhabdus alba TaxID=2899544 RepID=A0A6L6IQH4_9ENTR|nr:DUF6246 family protein [Intestinirhabdus alba]MTH47250.1 hypothetical protein [Intestinirhabdus alba]
MKPLIEIGEMRLSEAREGGKDYVFKPSFAAMSSIGSPAEIVAIFSLIHGSEVNELLGKASLLNGKLPANIINTVLQRAADEILTSAMQVMHCCYTGSADLQPLIGEWKGWSRYVVYRPGLLPRGDIIVLAQQLMQHGIIGKAKIRRLQRHEANEYSNEFRAIDYIVAACNHFGISREEAAGMTMTEFTLRLAAKYPNEKGMTREEYDSVADAYLARQAARRARAAR